MSMAIFNSKLLVYQRVHVKKTKMEASNGGTPSSLAGLFHGKSIYKWMITGGTSILANQHFDVHQLLVTLVALGTQIAMFRSFHAKSQTFLVMPPNSI